MLTLKASAAAAIVVGTAAASAGAGYVVSRATMAAQVAVSCPAPAAPDASSELPHSFPSGPAPALNTGKKF
jgi:hypothetical protein